MLQQDQTLENKYNSYEHHKLQIQKCLMYWLRSAVLGFIQVWADYWFTNSVLFKKLGLNKQNLQAFTKHINSVDNNINFKNMDMHNNNLAFMDCAISVKEGGVLKIMSSEKPITTDQNILFDFYNSLGHKLTRIRTLHRQA